MHDHARELRAAGWKQNLMRRWYDPRNHSGCECEGVDWGYTLPEALVRSGVRQQRG